jgi:hypothetical protein
MEIFLVLERPCGQLSYSGDHRKGPAAGDLFDGLQSNLIDHMVSREPKKISMVSKMQKKCAWSEMYQNDGLPWIYPVRADMRASASRRGWLSISRINA